MRALLNLFRKVSEPTKAMLKAHSPAEAAPGSGLLMIEIETSAPEPRDAVLRVTVESPGAPSLEKPLRLGPERTDSWVALHGHLLPNGPVKVRLDLVGDDGERLAGRTLTLGVRNRGDLARAVAGSLKATGVPLLIEGRCDSTFYDYDDASLTAWFDGEPEAAEAHIAGLEASGAATPEEAQALRDFVSEGYLVLPEVVAPEHLARLNEALDDAVARKVEGYEWGASQRIHNLHNHYPAVRELWVHPRIMRMLGLIFGEPAKPCQTLTYVFGSEQQYHQDTIHLTSFPAGRMCGVWTALEDVAPDSGELVVFPGSHRARRIYMHDAGAAKVQEEDWSEFAEKVVPLWTEIREGGYSREVYRPKAGTVLIWHENLLHAGSPRLDRTKSRRSIVGHYFSQGAVVYYDSSGRPGLVTEVA